MSAVAEVLIKLRKFPLFLFFWEFCLSLFCLDCAGSLLQGSGSLVAAHGLSCLEAWGISPDQDRTCVLCIGRWILNPWTTREVPLRVFIVHECWILWSALSRSMDVIMWFFFFSLLNVVNYIDFVLSIETALYSWEVPMTRIINANQLWYLWASSKVLLLWARQHFLTCWRGGQDWLQRTPIQAKITRPWS